jgi:hypothetical protein
MMALLPIILFVTTDIYEKVKIRLTIKMNDEKIDMIANVIKSLLAFRVYADNRPKTLRFTSQPRFMSIGKCIVGCIFNSIGLIITREIPCILLYLCYYLILCFILVI